MKNIPPIFVVHVRGNKLREEHVKKELSDKNLSFEFILDGNKEDLNDAILKKYFSEGFAEASSATSCVYKHILIYKKILAEKIEQALIFEDDIVLYKDFLKILDSVLNETQQKGLENYLISLESYSLNIITKPKKNQFLYRKESGRCAGAYLVDYKFAYNAIRFVEQKKCHLQIDWMHNIMAKQGVINVYWAHPPIAEQKSHNGTFDSLLNPDMKRSFFRRLNHNYKKYLKSKFYAWFSIEK